MNGFLSHLFFQCLAVALLYARHLVIAASVQLVVGNGRGRSIEMIQRNRLISIRECFNIQRIGSVIYQHFGIAAQFGEVDNIVIDILVVTLDTVVPSEAFSRSAECLNHFARPHFGEYRRARTSFRQCTEQKTCYVSADYAYCGRKTRHAGESRTCRAIERDGRYKGRNGQKHRFEKFHCLVVSDYLFGISVPYSALYRRAYSCGCSSRSFSICSAGTSDSLA